MICETGKCGEKAVMVCLNVGSGAQLKEKHRNYFTFTLTFNGMKVTEVVNK
jgi:hypothetical protein